MLADDLIANGGSLDDRLMDGAFTALGRELKRAQWFDLSPEVMRSAQTVIKSPIDAQLRALALCRLPFPMTWFEWPGNYSGEASSRGPMAPVPKRMGALVTCEDGSFQRGSIVYAWHQERMGANICPLAVTFDWRAEPEPLADLAGTSEKHPLPSDPYWQRLRELHPRVQNSSIESIIEDNRRFGVIITPWLRRFVGQAFRHGAGGRFMQAAYSDLEGEAPLLRSAILLLNSRNVTEQVSRPAPPRLNHARRKSGKVPLGDYTHVRIRLSHALADRAGMAADPRSPSRLHLVRGHFKIRRTGVFWWAPFARGHADQGELVRQTRHVAA